MCLLQAIVLCDVSAILIPYFLSCIFLVASCFDGRYSDLRMGVEGSSVAGASDGVSSGSSGLKKRKEKGNQVMWCTLADHVAQAHRVKVEPLVDLSSTE